jgi:tetratricopeptide (TPR) repeat protein
MTSEDDVNLPVALGNLGNCFYARYEYTGSLQDLADAISAQRRTVQLSPGDDGDLPAYLINLGNLLQCRFNVAGDLGDISEAISVQQRAIYSTPKGHPYLPARLNNLGNSLSSRFRSTAHLPDIVEAILAHKRGMELISEGSGHPHLPALLNGLGSSLRYRFNHTGDLEDLAEAISAQRRAVHLVPVNHLSLPFWLNSLGEMLRSRFERNRDPHDISEAVSEQRRAVDLTPEGHVQLAIRLNSLVISLQSRFRHARDIQDLDESISVQRRAILPTKEDHVNLPVYLNNLGISYMLRFGESGDLPDIDGAISAQRKALSLTPMGSAQRSAQYTNLGNSFLARYQQTGNDQDIAGALLAHQRAVELVPEGHVCFPLCLKNLANCWYNRSASSGDPGHLDKSISNYRTAAMCAVGSPSIKLSAAIRWARLLNEHSPCSPEILTAFGAAVQMISLVAGLEETIQRRYALIQEYSDLSLEAATAAFRLKRPDTALEWLEQGRSLVWNQQSQLRTPLDELRLHDSGLADRAMNVARRLEHAASSSRESNAGMNPSDRISLEDEARDHVHLASEWEDVLAKIRAVPSFEDFLRPSPFSALVQHLPTSGFLVLVNVHENRCDAIALRGGSAGAVHIPLPIFSLEKANKYRSMISDQLHSQGVRGRGDISEPGEEDGNPDRALMPPSQRARLQAQCGGGIRLVLGGLWKELVKPILNKLGISVSSSWRSSYPILTSP